MVIRPSALRGITIITPTVEVFDDYAECIRTTLYFFAEFYPFYLAEHANPICRALHYTGSLSALLLLGVAFYTGQALWVLAALLAGYGQAWIGHFFFEHNRPATFQYPLWSFMGDWVMLKDFLSGNLRQKLPKP